MKVIHIEIADNASYEDLLSANESLNKHSLSIQHRLWRMDVGLDKPLPDIDVVNAKTWSDDMPPVPNTSIIKTGDIVYLKSGGPEMVVRSEWRPGTVKCAWFDITLQCEVFPIECLTKVNPNMPTHNQDINIGDSVTTPNGENGTVLCIDNGYAELMVHRHIRIYTECHKVSRLIKVTANA